MNKALTFALLLWLTTHDGHCYGVLDGKWPCEVTAYVWLQIQHTLLFTWFFTIAWWATLLITVAVNLGSRRFRT